MNIFTGKVLGGKVLVEGVELKEGSLVAVLASDDGGPVTPTPEEKAQREFHVEEFKQLKGEIAGVLSRIDTLARYVIVVSAAVFAWLAVQGLGIAPEVAGQPAASPWCLKLPSELYRLAWYIPPAFAVLSGLAALVGIVRVGQMGRYIRQLEVKFGHPSLGWEKALESGFPIIKLLGLVFWIAVGVSTFYTAHVALRVVDKGTIACPAEKK